MSVDTLPALRFGLDQAARLLNTTRATLYCRIKQGSLIVHKDGRRVYVSAQELERYVAARSAQIPSA